jgi:hypothetical protein
MTTSTPGASGQSAFSPFNVVALYASAAKAEVAASTLQSGGVAPGAIERVDRTSPTWTVLHGSVAERDEELIGTTTRRIFIGGIIGAIIGLIVGGVVGLIIFKAAGGDGSAVGAEIVGAIVGLVIGALLGGFYGGALSLSRPQAPSPITANAAALALHADDADSMARLVGQLEATAPERITHFGPDGRPQPTRDTPPS